MNMTKMVFKLIRNVFTITFLRQLFDFHVEFIIENVAELRKMKRGKNTSVSSSVRIFYGENISIGDHTNINRGCYLWASPNSKIAIGSNCLTGPGVLIISSKYKVKGKELIRSYPEIEDDINIGDDVWLGANVVVLPGISIGNGAIIGSGVVVSKDVKPYGVIVNNQPRQLRER